MGGYTDNQSVTTSKQFTNKFVPPRESDEYRDEEEQQDAMIVEFERSHSNAASKNRSKKDEAANDSAGPPTVEKRATSQLKMNENRLSRDMSKGTLLRPEHDRQLSHRSLKSVQ